MISRKVAVYSHMLCNTLLTYLAITGSDKPCMADWVSTARVYLWADSDSVGELHEAMTWTAANE